MTGKYILWVLCAVFMLSACEGTKETLGLNRQSPDEFAVVKRAPLALPPNYALRPPNPGAPRPQEQAAADQAKAAMFGQTPSIDRTLSRGESVLLQRVGTDTIDPEIRRKVDAETATRVDKNKPIVDKILSIGRADTTPASVVDPVAEAERLKSNREAGQPLSEGETPSIED